MKLVIIDKNNKARLNKLLDWALHIAGYTIAFLLVSLMFGSFVIGDEHVILYSIVAVILVYILNKTVKPFLFLLTLPLTGLTLGISYFALNMLILKVVDWIMGPRLAFTKLWTLFFIALFISIINVVIEVVIIKPIIRRFKRK